MIVTLFAASLAAVQPTPAIDHSKMDHSKMDHAKMHAGPDKAGAKMDCCKDGCTCCAKGKAKPAS